MNQWPQFFGAFLLLAIDAHRAQQWGFVLPEGAWFLFTLPSLLRAWRARRPAGPS